MGGEILNEIRCDIGAEFRILTNMIMRDDRIYMFVKAKKNETI